MKLKKQENNSNLTESRNFMACCDQQAIQGARATFQTCDLEHGQKKRGVYALTKRGTEQKMRPRIGHLGRLPPPVSGQGNRRRDPVS